jgi:flotillin
MLSFEAGAVLGIVAVLVVVIFAVFSRLKIASPDQALIVVTKKKSDDGSGLTTSTKIVTGGRVLVLPFVQKAYPLSLQSHQLDMSTTAQTSNGITLVVDAVAMIKVDGKEEMIRAAAQRFLSDQSKIQTSTTAVLSGSLRSVIGGLDVTAIIRDRAAVASAVLEAVSEALSKQGLALDTLQIQEIRDTDGYIHNIGRPEAARVKQEADIADVKADQASNEARIMSEKVVMERTRELKLRAAEIQKETDEATAIAEAAKPRETAIQKLRIVEAQQQTAVQETALKEAQLNAEVRKVADANAYQVETAAAAAANATISAANAEREARQSLASAVAAEGAAEATSIEAKGRAEAVVILERAKALESQSQAVLAQDLIARLPELMGTMANAYSGIDNLTIVSADGPSKITGDMVGNVKGVIEMVKDTVGIDLANLLTGAVTGKVTGNAIGNSLSNEPSPIVSKIIED